MKHLAKKPLVVAHLALILLISGCTSAKDSTSDSVEGGAVESEAPGGESDKNSEGWTELGEAIGDESYVDYRLTPEEPQAGQPVKVEVLAGSAYGHFQGKAFVKTGAPESIGHGSQAANAEGWQELKQVKSLIELPETGKKTPVEELQGDELYGAPGETYFEGRISFPQSGKSAIGLKFVYAGQTDAYAFELPFLINVQ